MSYFLSSPSLVKNIGQIIYENIGDDKSIGAMQTCYMEFYSSNKTYILARPRLNLFNNKFRKYTSTKFDSKLDRCIKKLF